MKKIRLALTSLAFCLAVAAALATSTSNLIPKVYGHTSTDACVEGDQTIQSGCSKTNSGPQCTVFIAGSPTAGPNQIAPAYHNNQCMHALRIP
jgi:hypothetical protein